jgi:hypothetical protein
MNWRGGLFRIWIVASLIWIGVVSFVAYQKILLPRLAAAEAQRCAALVLWFIGEWIAAGFNRRRL